uniref:Nuclear pore complex protein Nup160 n=1 Tax=Aceria tosichella TaxID=561515 RepID=A0A6G1SJ61_9ACAR
MEPNHSSGFVEIASPQLLDDRWREFTFDLASGQNVLQDIVMPETGSGHVYRDAKRIGSATHNRFIYWRTINDIIELVEISTEVHLEDNQVRVRFVNSPIINNVHVIEFSDSIVLIIATTSSVHRLYLPHPKTTNRSVLADLTSDVLFNTSNYYIIAQHGSASTQYPISASSWFDKSLIKCALSFPDSSLLIVQFGHLSHQITTSEIKQTGIIGRLWSKMPNLWAKSPNECDNAVFSSAPFHSADDVLLFTLCRDCRIRVFSINTSECICSYNMIPQASFHQSFAGQANATCEVPMLKIFGSQVIVYLSEEFILLEYSYIDGAHELRESLKVPAPSWEHIIDFALTHDKIWALGSSETESTLYHMDLEGLVPDANNSMVTLVENDWFTVGASDEPARSLVVEIFWSNRFSTETVRKALIGLAGPQIPNMNNMFEIEEFASTRIFDGDQDKQWAKFYNYCLQNHQKANKNIGLVAAEDGSVVSVIKRSNPSFVCPWSLAIEEDAVHRGIPVPNNFLDIMKDLNRISANFDESLTATFEHKLFEEPAQIMTTIEEIAKKLNFKNWLKTTSDDDNLIPAIEYLCDCLDLTEKSREFNDKILKEFSTQMRSEHNPMSSNSGIMITYELFKLFVRSRMVLARDILVYICILDRLSNTDDIETTKCEHIYSSGNLKRLLDCLRSYGILVWIAEAPIKNNTHQICSDVIDFIARYFEYFKSSREISMSTATERILHQNLLMSFLVAGGINYSYLMSEMTSHEEQTLSNSYYATNITQNLCKLLWPKSKHLSVAEFMFTEQLDEHLAKYLDLTQDWLDDCEDDRHFIRAANCMLQNRAIHGVGIFNRLWMRIQPGNILGRFLGLDQQDAVMSSDQITLNQDLIYQYYEKLIQLFQIHNNRQCLVMLINHCMSLIDEKSDCDQQNRINCLRAKLFQFHLELEDSDEAYHTMVLTTEDSLRINCLRKFIVSHCEKEQWLNLLSYPFIGIKNDFIDILNQKAESLDLSKLNNDGFYKTSYYDLLFASHVSDDNYRSAAEIMYNYAQRLAQEVPGITSIRKQADCLLIALNTLRCVEERDKYLEFRSAPQKEKIRISILKRSHDFESDDKAAAKADGMNDAPRPCTRVGCQEIEQKYELTRARLRLLEKDQTGNAIALSPLTPEEIVGQLVASGMFPTAMDLSLLFGTSMEPILEGLTAKYILIMRLSTVDITVHQDIERGLTDSFTSSYSTIDTYNYVANSTSPLVDRLWRLIYHYLVTYDGVSHTYHTSEFVDSFASSTVLMRVVATKLLSAGYSVPASLRRLYLMRNTAELLKLLMKYDQLIDAAELATEMIDRTLEPANCLALSSPYGSAKPRPLYLPTHLILLLISNLNEDATDMERIKAANSLVDRLNRFRNFVKSN